MGGNGFTANLNINYRAPIITGSEIILIARAMKIEGRKVHLSAEIRSRNKDDYDKLYVEAECLFITSNKLKQIEKVRRRHYFYSFEKCSLKKKSIRITLNQ